jgi:hypothetical protein
MTTGYRLVSRAKWFMDAEPSPVVAALVLADHLHARIAHTARD